MSFWLILLLLNIYFILHYNVFFRKVFFSNVHTSVNTIFECYSLFFGWEVGYSLSTYATGGMKGSSRMYAGVYRWREVSRLMCTFALILSFHTFVLWCLAFFCRNLITFIQIGFVCQKWLFFSTEIKFVMKYVFFCFKMFFRTKISQNTFNFD